MGKFEDDLRHMHPFAGKTIEAKDTLQMQADYNGRTDSQPVYLGFAAQGVETSADRWLIYLFTYDGSNQVLTRTTAVDVPWDDRADAGTTYS